MEYFFTFALLLLVFFVTIVLVIVGLIIVTLGQKNKKEDSQIFLFEAIQASLVNQDGIRRVINNHNRRLQKLKEQKALYGLNAPVHLLMEIENIEAEIEQLQTLMMIPALTPPVISNSDQSNDGK